MLKKRLNYHEGRVDSIIIGVLVVILERFKSVVESYGINHLKIVFVRLSNLSTMTYH